MATRLSPNMITTLFLAATLQSLTPAESKSLTYLREEEKLALDVYTELGKTYNMRIFTNIAKAEQRHTDSIKSLLVEFKLPDPAATTKPGEFKDKELQNLYTSLVTKGKKSLNDALNVGATIEDKDIFDLTKSIKETKNEKLLTTMTQLLNGSKNHMRAFYGQLKNRNIEYKPQYITKQELESILGD